VVVLCDALAEEDWMTQALRILVIEDDPTLRQFMLLARAEEGYDLQEAVGGAGGCGAVGAHILRRESSGHHAPDGDDPRLPF
jgi:hypothetical protein